jgi:hypothetical protein
MMSETTVTPAQCAKCLREINYEPRILMEDGRILCNQCFNEMLSKLPKNMEIKVNLIQKLPCEEIKNTKYTRANVNITIGIYPTGRIVCDGFVCDIAYPICWHCRNRELCSKLRKELDKLNKFVE